MLNIAEKIDGQGTWLGGGLVKSIRPGPGLRYLVNTEFGDIEAERADGCLVAPEIGDRVLMVLLGDDEAYILNVLKRKSQDKPVVISTKGDAALKAGGALDLLAARINIGGVKQVSIKSDNLDASCMNAEATFRRFSFRGHQISGRSKIINTAAEHIETVSERIIERVKRRYRRVEEFEEARIGRMSLWVKDLFSVKSKSTSIKAEGQVKMDADKILLG